MKAQVLQIIFAVFLSVLSNTTIAATLFNRSDFGANAVEFGFDTFDGDTNPGDGNFSAQGVLVRGVGDISFADEEITEPFAVSGTTNLINFTFDEPASAFGFNFAINNPDPFRFFIADSNNNEIESFTLNPADFSSCTSPTFFVCGFIGLDAGSNQISSAGFQKINTFSNFGPIIDNVIYETVPTPGILWLLSTGFLGLYWSRKRNLS